MYNITKSQKLIYDMHTYADNSISTITAQLKFEEDIDVDILKKAISLLIKNNDALRIRIKVSDSQVMQYVSDYSDDLIIEEKVFETDRDLEDYAVCMAKEKIDFEKKVYNIVIAYNKEKNKHSVIISINHIIGDAWSMFLLKRELLRYYDELSAGNIPESNSDYTYVSHVEKEANYLKSSTHENDKKYWEEQFEDYDHENKLEVYPDIQGEFAAKRIVKKLSSEQSDFIDRISQESKASPFSVVLSLLSVYLHKVGRCNDFCIGTALYNRFDNEEKNTIGMFVNTVPMRMTFEKNDSFNSVLKKNVVKSLGIMRHQRYNYGEMLDTLEEDTGRKGLYDITFVYQVEPDNVSRINTEWYFCENQNEILAVTLIKENGGYSLLYDYKCESLNENDVDVLNERLMQILISVAENADQKLDDIEMITSEEKRLILNDFNATETEYPRDKTVAELFEEQVKKTPDNIALVFRDEELTYAELNKRANVLGNKLRGLGVKPDDFVAVIADRSIEMLVAIYGVMKSGGAYVPIDPTLPEERISYMLEDSKPKAVLKYTTESINIPSDISIIDLSESEVWEGASEDPEIVNKPEDLLYCIYTSGTTGKPKGVMQHNRTIVNLVYDQYRIMGVEAFERVLYSTNCGFDVSAEEYFSTQLCGGTGIIITLEEKQDAAKCMSIVEEKQAKTMFVSPSYFDMLSTEETDAVIKNIKAAVLGGEPFRVSNLLLEREDAAHIKMYNIYGPTETHVATFNYKTIGELKKTRTMNLGKSLSNLKLYIMNGNSLCGIGVPGELCIAGDGVARGYLNRPELTAERFVKNPFGEGMMYHSGDLTRWLPDGTIEFMGRIDEQVKIRGFRIELGEIDSRIREIENIKDCAVIAKADSNGDKAIYAYYTSDIEVSVSEIRDRLSESLPEYMVPAYMMQIESIPVTRNGKLDKKALPEIEARATREYVAPRNEIEEKICAIFSEILNVEQVGVKDSFFELGGHSLRATRLVNQIEAETGTRIALKDVFAHPTAEQLAVLAGGESEEYVPIPKAEEKEYYAMSSAQKRTYLIQQMQPEAVTYNMPGNLKLTGEVRPDDLRAALQAMTDRHEILRTQFLMIDGEPVQKILDHVDADFEYVTSTEDDEKLMKEFLKPFDLASAKLVRIKLVNKGEYHLMMFDMHHIVSDGMSINTFTTELMALYNGEKLEPLTHQFRDYSEWMLSRDLSGQAEYWKSQFEDEIPVLDMPTDFPRPPEQSYAGSVINSQLDEKLSGKINELVKKSGATEYMVFLAAAMVMLSKYSRQEDIVIGSPISGRTHRDTEGMLGMFVNTLAMRGRPEKDKTFSQFLEEIKNTCLKAYENQEYPFEELVEAVDVQRDMSRNPLFDVMLVYQNNESVDVKLGDGEAEKAGIESTIAKFDMTFNMSEYEGKFVLGFEYCTDLFKAETANRIVKHFEEILKAVTANADQKLGDIEMVTAEERITVLNTFNATETEYPKHKTVVELFEEQVKKTPNNDAVVFGEAKLSFAELNERANVLGNKLRELGVGRDDFVAIIADRSIEMIAGIYGIIKAGGAYVPIDPKYPEDRIVFMLEDSAPKAILKYTAENVELNTEIPVIDLSDKAVWEGNTEAPEIINKPEDLIYCIYTSGTTGKPKGVMNRNYGLINRIHWMNGRYPIGSGDTILQKTTFTFDVSVWEIIWWSIVGARVAMLVPGGEKEPDTICDSIEKYQVTTMHFVPSMLSMFEEYVLETEGAAKKLKSIKNIFASGEALKKAHVDNFYKIAESADLGMKLANFYGPTEACIDVTYYDCVVEDRISVPIGKPIDNIQIYIVNGKTLCGVGVPGELCIAGDGLARGYLNRPELNEEKFAENLFGEGKMYHSGDLARWLPDGNIEYLGRIDEQVKIRGFRIELGEIVNVIMNKIDYVKDCAVAVKTDKSGDKNICAYVVSDKQIDEATIKSEISKFLTSYMVPAYIMQIDRIPITNNGKLNRRALPDIEHKHSQNYVAARNDVEENIVKIYEKVLGIDHIGVTDNFFDIGGNSIKLISVYNNIEKIYPGVLKLAEMFAYPTIETLAKHIVNKDKENNQCNIEIKATKFPGEFFDVNYERDESSFSYSFDEDFSSKLGEYKVYEFLLGVYIFLISKTTGETTVNIQALFENNEDVYQIQVNIEEVENFFDIIQLIRTSIEESECKYSLKNYIKKPASDGSIVPAFIVGDEGFNYSEYYDLVLAVNNKSHINVDLIFNSNILSTESVEKFFYNFTDISMQIIEGI